MPKGISKLVFLPVLRLDFYRKLSVEENEFLKLEHFVNLINLCEVSINIHHRAELKSIKDGILALTISNGIADYADLCKLPHVLEKMLAMKNLEFLRLDCFAVPKWICGFSNLMQLHLWSCHCAEYPALEMMPNLIQLKLEGNLNCKPLPKWFWKPQGFPQLCHFRIGWFNVLEELPELKDGVVPRLEVLYVYDFPNLKKVPHELELLKTLKPEYIREGWGILEYKDWNS